MGQGRPDGGRPHQRLRSRPGALLVLLPAAISGARRQGAQPGARGAGRAGAAGDHRGRDHPEHRPPAPGGGVGERDRGARLDRHLVVCLLRNPLRSRRGGWALRRTRGGDLHRLRRSRQTRRRPLRRDASPGSDRAGDRTGRGGGPDAVRRLFAGGPPGGRLAAVDPRSRWGTGNRHQGRDPLRRRRRAEARR